MIFYSIEMLSSIILILSLFIIACIDVSLSFQNRYFSSRLLNTYYSTTTKNIFLSESTVTPTPPPSSPEVSKKNDKIDLLYDSECPICQMEVDFLKKRDIDNHIRFTDLSSANYNPDEHGHVQFEEGMRKLHAVLPDGRVVRGVEVFRQTYEAIGLGWVFAATSLPVIGQVADYVYDIWAENRLRLTGRTAVAEILKQRAAELREMELADCDRDGCAIDF